jgi:hypothetical protein
MTRAEAQQFVDALRAGKVFATRHQEEEWGLSASADGTFRRWSHRLLQDGGEESHDETLSETELITLLETWYGFERMSRGLR